MKATRRYACIAVVALCPLFAAAPRARAHSLAVAAVQVAVDDADPQSATIVLKTPIVGSPRVRLQVRLEHCELVSGVSDRAVPGAMVSRWAVRCDGPVDGRQLVVLGLGRDVSEAVVTFRRGGASPWTGVASVDSPQTRLGTSTASPRDSGQRDTLDYFRLGVVHFALGPDHLLFVLGLLLVLARRPRERRTKSLLRSVVGTLTAFTVAHSITLALSALGHVRLSPPAVELVIALSILLLAVELTNSHEPGQRWKSWTFQRPGLVAFAFGLLHGFGFAGALDALGLPQDAVAPALLLFNLGVEVGQLAFVVVLLALGVAVRRVSRDAAVRAGALAANAMGVAAGYWTLARAVDLLRFAL